MTGKIFNQASFLAALIRKLKSKGRLLPGMRNQNGRPSFAGSRRQ
jgi:hypothetical protein